jgi:hypothetical protein
MRKRMGALFIAAVCVYGCSTGNWNILSEVGRRCFFDCESRYHQCGAYCPWHIIAGPLCNRSCRSSMKSCVKACPDVEPAP